MTRILSALLLLTCSTSAYATDLVFDFTGSNTNLGPEETYTDGIYSVTARGFSADNVPQDLFGKGDGGNENGLGLTNDPLGEHEIVFGLGFVEVDVNSLTGLNALSFRMNSVDNREAWAVYGNSSSGVLGTLLFGGSDEAFHSLDPYIGSYNFFSFISTVEDSGGGDNVLLRGLTASVSAVPEPATWALMVAGFGLVGAATRRRRHTIAVAYS